jgi:hypothetical protein
LPTFSKTKKTRHLGGKLGYNRLTTTSYLVVLGQNASKTMDTTSPPLPYTDKKEYKMFLIFKEIRMGSGAKSYIRKGYLIYDEMLKFSPIYEEAVSHI